MLCVTDRRIPDVCVSELLRLGFELVLLPPLPDLSPPIASHTDLLVLPIGKTILTHARYATIAERELSRIAEHGYKIEVCNTAIGDTYPRDVALCACVTDKYLICNVKHTAPEAIALAQAAGLKLVGVSQGYAKCSCAVLSDGAIITADAGIYNAICSSGGDALLISAGHIFLPPYKYGFIGGASGLCADTLFFAGSIETHPDCRQIVDFCSHHKTRVYSLSDDGLFDVGSMIFI